MWCRASGGVATRGGHVDDRPSGVGVAGQHGDARRRDGDDTGELGGGDATVVANITHHSCVGAPWAIRHT